MKVSIKGKKGEPPKIKVAIFARLLDDAVKNSVRYSFYGKNDSCLSKVVQKRCYAELISERAAAAAARLLAQLITCSKVEDFSEYI